MAETQHTPGRWTHDGLCIFAGTDKRRIIASVAADRDDEAFVERRANLDMMTHGKEVVHECVRPGGLLWMAEQWLEAIGSKAMNRADFEERLETARAAIAKAEGR